MKNHINLFVGLLLLSASLNAYFGLWDGAINSSEASYHIRSAANYSAYDYYSASSGSLEEQPTSYVNHFIPYFSKGPYQTILAVQNLSPSLSANLTLYFFAQDSSTAILVFIDPSPVAPLGSKKYDLSALSGLPVATEGCVVISSNTEIHAIVNLISPTSSSSIIYSGRKSFGAGVRYAPKISRSWQNKTTEIWVQNTYGNNISITLTFTPVEIGNAATVDFTLQPYTTHVFKQSDMPELGDSFSGYVKITGGVATAVIEKDSIGDQASAMEAIPVGGSSIYFPLQQKGVNGWSTNTHILNTSDQSGNINAEFFDLAGNLIWSDTPAINGSQIFDYNLAEVSGLPEGFDGSLKISSSLPLVAQSNWYGNSNAGNDTYTWSRGIDSGIASDSISIPYAVHAVNLNETLISIKNISNSQIACSVEFENASQANLNGLTIQPHGILRLDTSTIALLGNSWSGSIRISATDSILAEVSILEFEEDIVPPKLVFLPIVNR